MHGCETINDQLRSEKLLRKCFRTWVRLPPSPPNTKNRVLYPVFLCFDWGGSRTEKIHQASLGFSVWHLLNKEGTGAVETNVKILGKSEQKVELCVAEREEIHTKLQILHKRGRLTPFFLGRSTQNSTFCTKLHVNLDITTEHTMKQPRADIS